MSFFASFLIYVASFALSIFCYNFSKRCTKRTRVFFIALAIVIPALMSAFRTSGTDLHAYISIYERIHAGTLDASYEPLWVLLNAIAPTREIWLFLSSVVFLTVSHLAIRRHGLKNCTLAYTIVLLVFFSVFFNIMRQMLAVAIIFYGYYYLERRRYLPYILSVVVAMMFHKSAILMLALLLLKLVIRNDGAQGVKDRHMKVFSIAIFACAAVAPFVASPLFRLIAILTPFDQYVSGLAWNPDLEFLICMLPPVVLFYLSGGHRGHSAHCNELFLIYICCLPIQTLGFMATYVNRMVYYFYFFVVALVPAILDDLKGKRDCPKYQFIFWMWFLLYYVLVFAVFNTADAYPFIKS